MECNREELRITAGGLFEDALTSAKPTNLPEARVARFPPSRNQVPIAEEFSHPASPWDSDRGLPGIFWSPQSSNRPTSRSAFPRRNRLSRALAESRKCAQEWGLFAPSPGGLIFSMSSTGALSCPAWKPWISLVLWTSFAPRPRKHPAPPLPEASGPGDSRFELVVAWVI
jgi:hypothetical protein